MSPRLKYFFVQERKAIFRLIKVIFDEKAWWVAVEHFTDQNWIPKTVYCFSCVMVCKNSFTYWNAKIALLPASMVVTYYIKLFRTGADRNNGILMSRFLPVAETIRTFSWLATYQQILLIWLLKFNLSWNEILSSSTDESFYLLIVNY